MVRENSSRTPRAAVDDSETQVRGNTALQPRPVRLSNAVLPTWALTNPGESGASPSRLTLSQGGAEDGLGNLNSNMVA